MNDMSDYNYFLLISKKKISLEVLNSKNHIFFKKKITIDDLSINENLKSLENFLNKNIFEVEKNIKRYVKDIFLIIDYKDFISVDLSVKYNFKGTIFNQSLINNKLIDLKNQFKKTIGDYEIIHMIMNKFIIDGTTYSSLPQEMNYNDLSIEVKFICLQSDIIEHLKNILSKYQISIKRILFYDYLKTLTNDDNRNTFKIANNVLKGYNENEILLLNKSIKKRGFFEKFFNLFN